MSYTLNVFNVCNPCVCSCFSQSFSSPSFSSPSFSSPANSTSATSSVIFQSCKFHPLFLDGPSFFTPANSSHPVKPPPCTKTKLNLWQECSGRWPRTTWWTNYEFQRHWWRQKVDKFTTLSTQCHYVKTVKLTYIMQIVQTSVDRVSITEISI